MMHCRVAQQTDLAAIIALLDDNGLPSDDCAEQLAHLLLIEEDGALLAVAGLEPAGDDALLRSFAVQPAWQGQGLAAQLYRALKARAEQQGVRGLYLLTETAEGYFERLGFCRIARDDAPLSIQRTRQFGSLCPASAVLLELKLPRR